MSGFGSVFKSLLIPALIALLLYSAITFAILPFYRRYRQRYSQYLPLDAISTRTNGLRERLSDTLFHFLFPALWRRRAQGQQPQRGYNFESEGSLFDEEEGEGMVGFDVDAARRSSLPEAANTQDAERRLSRDLEEGFRDDSDDEREQDTHQRIQR